MAEPGEPLSERELDVLRCLAKGSSNKDIAADLTISENTVKVHLRNIYTKLAVSSRTEATTAGMQQGYIAVPGSDVTAELGPASIDEGGESGGAPDKGTVGATTRQQQAVEHGESTAVQKASRRPILIVGAVSIVLLMALLFGLQWLEMGQQTPAAADSFEETALGDTRWLTSRPMPEPRANMAVAAVGLDLYQIGGETVRGVDGVVQAFDSVERTWRTATDKPTAVADASAAELYGELYVAGGRLADGQPTSIVEAYSPTQDAWRPIASLPHPMSGSLTLSDGSFLYVVGGHDGDAFLDSAYVYDPASDSWRPLPTMPQAHADAAGAVLTGRLVVVGGRDGSGELDSCHQFDPATEQWSACPAMLLPRQGAGSAVLLNRLYVIGGSDADGTVTFSEMFDPGSETWQVINTPMLVESGGWQDLGVGQIETRIYALGGREGDAYLDSNYVFAPLVYQTYIPAASSADEE